MGFSSYSVPNRNSSTCLDVVKEAKSRERQSPDPAVLDSSSPWAGSTVCSARVTTPSVSVPVPPCTWPPSWSTSPLRSSRWQATPPVTTRRPKKKTELIFGYYLTPFRKKLLLRRYVVHELLKE